jgi:diguanylate cyclase (GGDEF)-like protein
LGVVHDSNGGVRIWAGCGYGLCSWPAWKAGDPAQPRDGGVTEWGKDQGLASDRWAAVHLDRTGVLWAGGYAHVAVLMPGAARFVDRSIPGPGLTGGYNHAPIIEDTEGRILVPAQGGIARWDATGWRIINQANGLEHATHINGMVFDAAGDLWFDSRGEGLYEWAGYANWESWGNRQGLPSASIWFLNPSNVDRVFLGTELGPAWIDPRHGSAGPLSNLRPWPYDQSQGLTVESGGTLIVASMRGSILRIDPASGRTKEIAKLPANIIKTFRDSSGRLFYLTAKGIYLSQTLAPGNGSGSPKQGFDALFHTPQRIPAADALTGKSVEVPSACESPGGADWFAIGSHLMRFKDGQWSLPAIDGMPQQSGRIYAISCSRDGAVWMVIAPVVTWRLSPSGDRLQAWQLVPPPELHTLVPIAILVDRRGWVWLGTDQGLAVWNGQSWRHLTQENGLIWNDVNQGEIGEASDGSLWIGTSDGVSHLLHPERVFDPTPLTVSLTAFQRGETSYLGARKATIPWGGSPLIFQISSPTMRNRGELTLKIRMAGYQSEWMETHDGSATFVRLPPGKFTFMAMACNSGLNACSAPVLIDIRILPPWWRTIWFYGLCGLAFIGILVGGVHLYARQLRARSRQLELLVSERTIELEASREQLRIQATHDGLTGMLNRTAVVRMLTAEMDRARRENRTVAIALVDLDHFKRINDTHGHMAGDEALRVFAAAVGNAIRPYDHAGRYGGEEFLLVLTELPREVVEQRLTTLHAAISNLLVCVREAQFTLNCSMGATVYDPSDQAGSVESMLAIADHALYAAKAEGRNRVVFSAHGNPPANSR